MIVDTSIHQLLNHLPKCRLAKLSGKSIWVIGAGSGYGKAATLLLASAGCQVFISGRTQEKLEQTWNMAKSMGLDVSKLIVGPADITNVDSLDNALTNIRQYTHILYGLVLTAAMPQNQPCQTPLLDFSMEQWCSMMSTNLDSAFLTIKMAIPLLIQSSQARILCFTSKAGWSDTLGFGPYNISKCALNAYVASVAQELRYRYPYQDIQINAIEPGEAFTEMNQGSPTSPLAISKILLHLLTTNKDGPSGKFFDREMSSIRFNSVEPYVDTL